MVDSRFIPPVIITRFQIFNERVATSLPSDEEIRLSYKDNFFSFEFAALDYTAPSRNHYAYMLEGFDKDWVQAGSRRYAAYTNLSGGHYVFRVKGSNSDGVWNETGVAVPIMIVPPFWETWWFSLLLVSGLVGSAAGAYGLRIQRFRSERKKLESQVTQRTVEIERRRQVAEGLRDLLTILNSHRDLNEMLETSVSQARRLLHSDAVVVYRLLEDGSGLAVQAAQGFDAGALVGVTIPIEAGRALLQGLTSSR